MVETVYRRTYDMHVRPATSDDLVCDEAQEYKALFIDAKNYDVFIDIGANIGSVIKLAKDIQPDMTVIGFEPDQENFEVLSANCDLYYNTSLWNSAIGTGERMVDLFRSSSSNKGKHSVIKRKYNNTEPFKVQQFDFKTELEKNLCTLLKIDIEGGEYELDLTNLPKNIKGLAIEFHLIDDCHLHMLTLYKIIKNQFSLVLGEVPEEDSIEYFRNAYSDNDAFMCIFLRNTK